MSEADLNIVKYSIKLVEDKVYRDFEEIKNLQNSGLLADFVSKTVAFIQNKLYNYFIEKRPEYSLYIKNSKGNVVENSKYSIHINALAGIKNFSRGIPYFCTTILIMENDKPVIGFVNNYATNEMFYVVKNKSAFLNNQKMRMLDKIIHNDFLVAVKYDLDRKVFKHLLDKLPMFKVNNCSVLDVCYTVCGKYDASIILDSNEEDINLCKLFVEESGGLSRVLKNNNKSYLFSNGSVVDKLVKLYNI